MSEASHTLPPAVPGAQAQNVTAPAPVSFVRFDNGMVMAFDRAGHQMLDYQGPYSQLEKKIRAVLPSPDLEFYVAKWRGRARRVTREEFHAAAEVQS